MTRAIFAHLPVKVIPRSSRDEIVGWRGDELTVKVTKAPADGKANDATCSVIAAALGVPSSAVSVARGATSRHKTLEIAGVGREALDAAFGAPETSP